MKLVTTAAGIQKLAQTLRADGHTIGLVPTMGWFHEGHLALMRTAKKAADRVIVSLFVNPIQFAAGEDLDSYPHDLDRDCALAEKEGVDLLFAPLVADMYGDGFKTNVHVDGLTEGLCGGDRPGHFDGVTTVVAKLFNLTLPHLAVFGEKDFQQLAVIRQMVKDLDFPIKIMGHPIVREENGLAMSSRNSYLQEDEMAAALSLSKSILHAKALVAADPSITVSHVIMAVKEQIHAYRECSVDYVEIVDCLSLRPSAAITANSVLVLAVKINQRVRLLDNSLLTVQ